MKITPNPKQRSNIITKQMSVNSVVDDEIRPIIVDRQTTVGNTVLPAELLRAIYTNGVISQLRKYMVLPGAIHVVHKESGEKLIPA